MWRPSRRRRKLRAETLARRYPDGDMTLVQWHSRHWPVIAGSVRASTARAYERGWRLRVKPWLGHMKLEKLTAGVIEEAIAGWEGSTSTRIDALAVLSRLLDGAVRAHLVPLNQARLARRPKSESTTSLRSRALTAVEVPILLAAIDDAHYRRYIAALVYTVCVPMKRPRCASRTSNLLRGRSTCAEPSALARTAEGSS